MQGPNSKPHIGSALNFAGPGRVRAGPTYIHVHCVVGQQKSEAQDVIEIDAHRVPDVFGQIEIGFDQTHVRERAKSQPPLIWKF